MALYSKKWSGRTIQLYLTTLRSWQFHKHHFVFYPQGNVKRYFREKDCVVFPLSEGTKTYWQCAMKPSLFFLHDKSLQQAHKPDINRLNLYQENNFLYCWNKNASKSWSPRNNSLSDELSSTGHCDPKIYLIACIRLRKVVRTHVFTELKT